MKIPRPSNDIKDATGKGSGRPLLALVLCAAVSSGCVHAAPSPAPLFSQPDTTLLGDLLGPFDGQVVDAAAGKPVAGALVYASWGFETRGGFAAPAGARVASVETDVDGRYQLPRLSITPPAPAELARFTLIVYKRGFVGWRSDRRFEDFGVRHDFAQHHAVIRLDRLLPSTSALRQVRYLGGGGALRRAMESDIVQAALELASPKTKLAGASSGKEAPSVSGPPLDATALLSVDELRAVGGVTNDFTVDRLADLPRSTVYDSKHFRAVGKPESFDAALRVWKLGSPAALDAKFLELRHSLPPESEGETYDNEVGDRSFRAVDGRLFAVVTEDRARGTVLEVTCGLDLCKSPLQVASLARRVLARTANLGAEAPGPSLPAPPTPPSQPAETTAPEKPPSEDNPFQLTPPTLHR